MVGTLPRFPTFRGTRTSRGSSAPCPRTTLCKFGRWLRIFTMTRSQKHPHLNWKIPPNNNFSLLFFKRLLNNYFKIPLSFSPAHFFFQTIFFCNFAPDKKEKKSDGYIQYTTCGNEFFEKKIIIKKYIC